MSTTVNEFGTTTTQEDITNAASATVTGLERFYDELITTRSATPEKLRAFAAQFNELFYEGFMRHFASYNAARAEAEGLAQDDPNLINVWNPITGQRSLPLKRTTNERAAELVQNAKAASDVLDQMPLEERLKIIQLFGEKLEKYQGAIQLAITADTGKPISIAEKEMTKGNAWVKYVTEHAPRELLSTEGGITTVKRPLGGAQIVGASNYPFALAIDGVLAAFAAGNGVIISATSQAPNWAFPVLQAAQEAVNEYYEQNKAKKRIKGYEWMGEFEYQKEHMFQVAVGSNSNLSNAIPMIQYVGSTDTGERIKRERGVKPTIAEMGGNNIVVVMESGLRVKATKEEDSPALGAAGIAKEIIGGMEPVGARCTAPRILCVQEGPASEVADILKDYADNPERYLGEGDILVGNPFNKKVKHGPMIDKFAHDKIVEAIAFAEEISPSQSIVHGKPFGNNGGNDSRPHPDGYWMRPVVIDLRSVDMKTLSKEQQEKLDDYLKHEIFGPIIFITHEVKNIDEAIQLTNRYDVDYKLAGSIYTGDIEEGSRYCREANITSGIVNGPPSDLSPLGAHGGNAETDGHVGGVGYLAQFTGKIQSLKVAREGIAIG